MNFNITKYHMPNARNNNNKNGKEETTVQFGAESEGGERVVWYVPYLT